MKKMQNTSKWNALECALLVMLAACLLVGAAALKKQDQLQQKMIRLHVVANSDSDRDQSLKLQVRDKVLAFTERTMRASADRAAANAALQTYLPVIERWRRRLSGRTAAGTASRYGWSRRSFR